MAILNQTTQSSNQTNVNIGIKENVQRLSILEKVLNLSVERSGLSLFQTQQRINMILMYFWMYIVRRLNEISAIFYGMAMHIENYILNNVLILRKGWKLSYRQTIYLECDQQKFI